MEYHHSSLNAKMFGMLHGDLSKDTKCIMKFFFSYILTKSCIYSQKVLEMQAWSPLMHIQVFYLSLDGQSLEHTCDTLHLSISKILRAIWIFLEINEGCVVPFNNVHEVLI